MKKILILLLVTALGSCSISRGESIDAAPNLSLSLIESGLRQNLVQLKSSAFETFVTEKVYSFDGVNPSIFVQTLKNGDILIYYRQPKDSPTRTFIVTLEVPGPITGKLWTHKYAFRSEYAGDPIKSSYDSKPLGEFAIMAEGPNMFDFGKGNRSVFVSRSGRFIEQPVGLIKRLADASVATVSIFEERIILSFELSETGEEWEDGWLVASREMLLDISNTRTMEALIVSDFGRVKILRHDGWWLTTQRGDYDGCEDNCYYPNPGFYTPRSLLRWFCQKENRLFIDVVLSSMKSAVETTPDSGYTLMPIVPELFQEWYGMGADYLDTRFSTDGARFLVLCAKIFGCKSARQKAPLLAKSYEILLTTHKNIAGKGYFLPDYIWGGPLKTKVHSSLNHILCVINYLLELSELTNDGTYLSMTQPMFDGLEALFPYWIKDNGDLWYAYFPDGNTFKRKDYPDLTYNDLKECSALCERVFGQKNTIIEKYLKIKRDYLTKIGLLKGK